MFTDSKLTHEIIDMVNDGDQTCSNAYVHVYKFKIIFLL